jgi:hypothetical protein
MPVRTVEQLKGRESAIKKKLAEKGESMDAGRKRRAKKQLRRTQRRRRKMVAAAAARAPKAAEGAGAGTPG